MAATRGPVHWFLWGLFVTIVVGVLIVRRPGGRFRNLLRRPAARSRPWPSSRVAVKAAASSLASVRQGKITTNQEPRGIPGKR